MTENFVITKAIRILRLVISFMAVDLRAFLREVHSIRIERTKNRARTTNNMLGSLILDIIRSDRLKIRRNFADKIDSKAFILDEVNARVPDTVGEVAAFSELDSFSFGTPVVVKPSHASGAVLIVGGSREVRPRLSEIEKFWKMLFQVQKFPTNGTVAHTLLKLVSNRWLRYRFTDHGRDEWAYSRLKKRLIIEEFVGDPFEIEPPDDLKIYFWRSEPFLIHVDSNRFGPRIRNYYAPDESLVHVSEKYKGSAPLPDSVHVQEAMRLGRELSKKVDFVRVDFFVSGNELFVGELTNYPEGGFGDLPPNEVLVPLLPAEIRERGEQ